MTETIIDGVDVAGCEFAVKTINDNRIKCHCAKGLLQIANMQEQPESIKSGLCENNPNCYYKQLKRLEQENAELKKNDCEQCKHLDLYIKYKQTLQEIKEIAERYLTDCQGFSCDAMQDILNIITKVGLG